ncbi:MAG: SemiSWEET transporter [Saprospiraceae bacterium]|nr:SemiSWEET transporter [Saprospiraceae bacterium]
MEIDWITALGLVAATLTTLAFLPQVIKTWKTKETKDLSLPTFSIFCTGVLLWLIYGLLIGNLPIILSNIVTFTLAFSILIMGFIYRNR